jgi:hypothetical protein
MKKRFMIYAEDLELLIQDSLELNNEKRIIWAKEKKEEHYKICMKYLDKIEKAKYTREDLGF